MRGEPYLPKRLGDPGAPGPFTESQIWWSYEQGEAYTIEVHPRPIHKSSNIPKRRHFYLDYVLD